MCVCVRRDGGKVRGSECVCVCVCVSERGGTVVS